MNATIPLDEALPWSPSIPRTILICDSIETDGRFLLHTLACQALKQQPKATATTRSNSVWWCTASPVTEKQIATALKKIGSDVAAAYLRQVALDTAGTVTSPLKISSWTKEIATQSLEDASFDGEAYLKAFYQKIKTWIQEDSDASARWLFLDDVSALAALLGDTLVYQFVSSLTALISKHDQVGLAIRCSYELDQALLKAISVDDQTDNTGWVGAGGLAQKHQVKHEQQSWIPWERSLEESVDALVDVLPLTSGYSREAHGRLIFSEYPGGRGWTDKPSKGGAPSQSGGLSFQKSIINYCLHDGGVRAIRLRGNTTMA